MLRKAFLSILFAVISFTGKAQMIVADYTNYYQSMVNSSKEIYQSALTTDAMLKNFQQTVKLYEQNKEYFDKLRQVTATVKNSAKVADCYKVAGRITDTYVTGYNGMLKSGYFSAPELKAIGSGYSRILQKSADNLRELQTVITPASYSMTDKERLDVISDVHRELNKNLRLVNYYTQKNRAVASMRSVEQSEKLAVKLLYGD